MSYEWDARKARANLAKHGVSFERTVHIFDGLVLERPDTRQDYGEERIIAIGEVDGQVLVVVYTMRNGNRRIISARMARHDEREAYHQVRKF